MPTHVCEVLCFPLLWRDSGTIIDKITVLIKEGQSDDACGGGETIWCEIHGMLAIYFSDLPDVIMWMYLL
jgi:hypothetical protein